MAEVSNVIYTGITQAGSDLDCKDGELSLLHNLINDGGVMRPVVLPDELFTLQSGEKLLYIHSTASYKHYIYQNADNELCGFEIVGGTRVAVSLKLETGERELLQVTSLGNTLIVLLSDGIEYLLYKSGAYKYLGNKPPELNIRFALKGDKEDETDRIRTITLSNGVEVTNEGVTIHEDDVPAFTTAVFAEANSYIAKERSENRFTSSFMVRWAYRMFNGAYMASPPVFMPLNMGYFPTVHFRSVEDGAKSFEAWFIGYRAKLQYDVRNYVMSEILEWSDLITDVEIYVSSPINDFDTSASEAGMSIPTIKTESWLCDTSYEGYTTEYGRYTQNDRFTGYAATGIHLTENEYMEKIRDTSLFYHISSIPLADLATGFTDVPMEEGVLNSLETRRVLSNETDEYKQHDKLMAEGAYVYNSRLNIYGIHAEKFAFPVSVLTAFTSFGVHRISTGDEVKSGRYDYFVKWKIRGGSDSCEVSDVEYMRLYSMPWYLFYPDSGAESAYIERIEFNSDEEEIGRSYATIQLEEHPYLQGAYHVGNPDNIAWSADGDKINKVTGSLYDGNKIYTSDVNNPFVFPLGGINTIGTGRIVGISSTTKALSQGQFGQFPLLAFSTDGIWALEVSGTGTYSSKQPMSRDVCTNAKSITQLDNAVIFVSEKGLMLVNGSEVVSISGAMDGASLEMSNIIRLDRIYEKEGLEDVFAESISIHDFLQLCRVAYDYPNNRIVLFVPNKAYAYVYSFGSGTWSTIDANFVNEVNDYPNTYVVGEDGKVTNISQKTDYDSDKEVQTLLLSRPLKFGDDEYKNVECVINRGSLPIKNSAMVIFASVDGVKYFPIGSSKGRKLTRLQGSGYKYFRIAIVSNMNAGQSISATSFYINRKWRNRGR